MPAFTVSLLLPDSFSEEFLALIPQHRVFINRLLTERIIEAYAISADRGRGWVIMNGESEQQIRQLVADFPLFPYFQTVEVDELFIFDSAAARFPQISLN